MAELLWQRTNADGSITQAYRGPDGAVYTVDITPAKPRIDDAVTADDFLEEHLAAKQEPRKSEIFEGEKKPSSFFAAVVADFQQVRDAVDAQLDKLKAEEQTPSTAAASDAIPEPGDGA